jgi:hypothetical protein
MVDATRSRGGHHDGSSTVVFLSLYLILLAFFILLTTISFRDQDRADAAIGSVTSTFGARLPEETVPGTQGTEGTFEQAPKAFMNAIRKVFQANLPAVKMPVATKNGIMRIDVPTLDLFRRGEVAVRRRSESLLSGVADGLVMQNGDWRFEVEIVLGSGSSLPSVEEDDQSIELRRAGNFAGFMRRMGVPAHSIRTGVRVGDRETTQLSFYARNVAKARLDLARGDE